MEMPQLRSCGDDASKDLNDDAARMKSSFQLTPKAIDDLEGIWRSIAADSQDAAERVESEILATCHRLAKHPLMGTKRQDITTLRVRFWTLTKFPNYVIVYRPETVPLQVVAILHGKRYLKKVLQDRR
jgi:plasmid stabilization system protein ParE